MRPIVIYDPKPYKNDYLSPVYFDSVYNYFRDKKLNICRIESGLLNISNSNILLNAQDLTPVIINVLKENNNSLFSFDINDSTYICDTYRDWNFDLIDCIFKVGGVQSRQYSNNIFINEDLTYTKRKQMFLPDDRWAIYNEMAKNSRIVSLPYTLRYSQQPDIKPFESRDKSCLIRGGNHYFRFHLFLNLLKYRLININSEFLTKDYFSKSLPERFRYCDDCISAIEKFGTLLFSYYKTNKFNCSNCYSIDTINNGGTWNNRCLPMFYWLTEQFEKTHGAIDKGIVEKALNGSMKSEKDLNRFLSEVLLYGDFKWLFSIYVPPRFWEAARAKTINFMPKFSTDQVFFPEVLEGHHYITYEEDFSNIGEVHNITKEQYEYISNNCFELYTKYIRPNSNYLLSTELMDFILNNIERHNA